MTKTSTKQNRNPPATLCEGGAIGPDETVNERAQQITEAGRDGQRVSKREEIRHLKRVHEYMRREARKIVNTMKKDAFRRLPRSWPIELRRKQSWRYAPDDTKIGNTADMERIRKVLELIGRPEEFDRIREAAFRDCIAAADPNNQTARGP